MAKDVIHLDANGGASSTTPFPTALYDLVGAEKEDSFTATSSGAEAVNQVLFSCFLEVSRKTGKCHFVTSAIEDAPTLQMMKRLEELGCFVKITPINTRGEIDIAEFEKLISSRTALVSITMAQGLTGVIQPTDEIAAICQKKNILLHLDATHAIGKYHFSMHGDYLTFSGGIFARKGVPLVPFILGGKPPANLSSLEETAKKSLASLDESSLEMPRLRSFFEKEILQSIPNAKVLLSGSLRLPNTSVIAFPFAHQNALHHLLQGKNIQTLVGGDSSQHLSALLACSKVDPIEASCTLSFSLPPTIEQEHLQQAVLEIKKSVEFLRSIAPPEMVHYDLTMHARLQKEIVSFRFAGSFSEEEAAEKGMRLATGVAKGLMLYLLVDETDGEIADVKFQCFGPIAFLAIGEAISELVIRKNLPQASRISADLIEQHLKGKNTKGLDALINQALMAIDAALEQCSDITCTETAYETTPIALDLEQNPDGIPGWEAFSHSQKLQLIEEVIDKEIRPYIELDAGGIKIIELKENHEVLISYEGACTTCPSATGSTLSAIQNILHARISPLLTVVPQF